MKIAEIFQSIQGEGKLAGVPSVFVRTSGCNLRCAWCDTPYTSWQPEGDGQSVDEIASRIKSFDTRHVVLTGGEPFIMSDIAQLAAAIRDLGRHLTIETAATIFAPAAMDLASLSPKLSNSTPHARESGRHAAAHERQRLRIDVIQQFIDAAPDFQLKFVVAAESDLAEIATIVGQLHRVQPADVLLMPEGIDRQSLASRAACIADACRRTGYRYCPRLHIELWGNRRGT
jgi:7-carboxy-7-deazaguanine synthase